MDELLHIDHLSLANAKGGGKSDTDDIGHAHLRTTVRNGDHRADFRASNIETCENAFLRHVNRGRRDGMSTLTSAYASRERTNGSVLSAPMAWQVPSDYL